MNITGASIGRCAFVPDDFGEGNVNQHVCIIRPMAKLNHKFLTYCLSAPWGQDQIFSSFTGASRQGLGQRDLGAIQVPFPPLPEQKRIAAYLDASCAAIDAAVAAKRRQLETLDALRGSIISRAVTYGIAAQPTVRQVEQDWLREIPSHWDVCRLKRVLARMDYGISESTNQEGRFPVLKMGHLSGGEISFSKLDFVDEVSEDLLLETGDLLYNRTNSPDQVGKAAIFRKPQITHSRMRDGAGAGDRKGSECDHDGRCPNCRPKSGRSNACLNSKASASKGLRASPRSRSCH